MTEYLFIGGHADGKRIGVVDNARFVAVPIVDSETALAALSSLPVTEPLIESYVRTVVWASDQDFQVYAKLGLTSADIMRLLIEHYRPLTKHEADEFFSKYTNRKFDR